jgi:hypothetical protein
MIDDRLAGFSAHEVDGPIVLIPPFSGRVPWHAGSEDGGECRVIGIRQRADGTIEMIALVTGDDGMVWPESFDQVQAALPG